jgi:hypothetical protein
MFRSIALALACLVAGVGLGGCIFSPKKNEKPPEDTPPPEYRVPYLPEFALYNLMTAYAARDSVAYRSTLDFEYQGSSTDDKGAKVSFNNIQEVQHIQAFARATTIVGKVFFSLGPEATWDRLPSDDPTYPEWAVIQIAGSNFKLEVNDTGLGTLTVNDPQDNHTFKFNPTTPAPSSPTDTLWTLVRWDEVQSP